MRSWGKFLLEMMRCSLAVLCPHREDKLQEGMLPRTLADDPRLDTFRPGERVFAVRD